MPSDGAWTGAMADLNGDGFDDLVLGMLSNTTHPRLNAFVYFGAEDGFSERRKLLLPAPICSVFQSRLGILMEMESLT